MKRYLLILTLICVVMTTYAQHHTTQFSIDAQVDMLQQIGDSVYVDMYINYPTQAIKRTATVNITPLFTSENQLIELPKVTIMGRDSYKAYQRMVGLKNYKSQEPQPYTIIKNNKSKSIESIHYKAVIAYQPWMNEAQFALDYEDCNCGRLKRAENAVIPQLITIEQQVEVYQITPHLAYIIPEVEQIKKRSIECEAIIDFPVGSSQWILQRSNNAYEMNRIISELNKVTSDSNVKIQSIIIEGYASPEGNIASNNKLATNRAIALKDELIKEYDFPNSFYTTRFGGEDWNGLMEALNSSEYPFAKAIVSIIEEEEDVNKRKARIKSYQGGKPYKEMLATLYPPLRKVVFKLNCDVQPFNIEKAKQVLQSNPEYLSLNEMYHVAKSYPVGSSSFNEVFDIAAQTFPQSEVAIVNAAVSALERGDYNVAQEYLNAISDNTTIGEYHNAMGVLLMMQDSENNKAIEYLNRAKQAGVGEASLNLIELEKSLK